MNDRSVIVGHAVACSFGGSAGLAPISFDLQTGRVAAITGRSGSGKSTLLAILAGWLEPTSGHLERAPGVDPGNWSSTAIVPQTIGLVAELTVFENVELPLRCDPAVDRATAAATITALLDDLDLDDLSARLPRELSLGQQQRVAIARAIVARPTVLLIDEPTSHQDADHAASILHLIRSHTGPDASTVLATHDVHVLADVDEVIELEHNRT